METKTRYRKQWNEFEDFNVGDVVKLKIRWPEHDRWTTTLAPDYVRLV